MLAPRNKKQISNIKLSEIDGFDRNEKNQRFNKKTSKQAH